MTTVAERKTATVIEKNLSETANFKSIWLDSEKKHTLKYVNLHVHSFSWNLCISVHVCESKHEYVFKET